MAAGNPQGFELHHDGAREAARLLTADRIVLQFPVQWYSMPPQLKAWQDAVLKTGKQYIVVTAGAARQSPERGDYVIAYSLP